MTTRERLKAAGWTQWYDERWLSPNGDLISEQQALAQLARDEAKETSDARIRSGNGTADSGAVCGGVDNSGAAGNRSVGASEVPNAPSGANVAPIATSVSAPDFWEKWAQGISNSNYGIVSKATMFKFADAYAREYASSSSAAPTGHRDETIKALCESNTENWKRAEAAESKELEARQSVVLVLRELRAAEAKVAELALNRNEWEEQAAQWMNKFNAAEDSRDRLQEALRFADEFLAHAPHTIVGTGGVTEHNPGMCAKCVVRAALGDPPERG